MGAIGELLGTDFSKDSESILNELAQLKKTIKGMTSRDSLARKADAVICKYNVLISGNTDAEDVQTYLNAYEAELTILTRLAINAIVDVNGTGAKMMKRIYNAESVEEAIEAQVDLGNYIIEMEDALREEAFGDLEENGSRDGSGNGYRNGSGVGPRNGSGDGTRLRKEIDDLNRRISDLDDQIAELDNDILDSSDTASKSDIAKYKAERKRLLTKKYKAEDDLDKCEADTSLDEYDAEETKGEVQKERNKYRALNNKLYGRHKNDQTVISELNGTIGKNKKEYKHRMKNSIESIKRANKKHMNETVEEYENRIQRLTEANESSTTSSYDEPSGNAGMTMSSHEGKGIITKYNNAQPSIVTYNFSNNGHQQSFDIGIKIIPEVLKASNIRSLFSNRVKRSLIIAVRRIFRGKDNFITDYVLALKKMKHMAIIEKEGFKKGKGFAHAMSKVLVKDYFTRFIQSADRKLPWFSVVMDVSDYKAIKHETGADILNEPNCRSVKNAMEGLMLLNVAILDSVVEEIHSIKDGEKEWNTQDMDNYASKNTKMSQRELTQMIKLSNR